MIKKIYIQNYKIFEHFDLEFKTPIICTPEELMPRMKGE